MADGYEWWTHALLRVPWEKRDRDQHLSLPRWTWTIHKACDYILSWKWVLFYSAAISLLLQVMISTTSWWALTCRSKTCRTSPKRKRDGIKFIFRAAAVSCSNFSRNPWSVFMYLLSYREKKRCSSVMVPAHSWSSNGKTSHVMGNHGGQNMEEGCQSRWAAQEPVEHGQGRSWVSHTRMQGCWPCSFHGLGLHILLIQCISMSYKAKAFVGYFQHECEYADEKFPFPLLLV